MLTGLHRNTDDQRLVGGMHVQLVIGIAHYFAIPGQWTEDAFRFASNDEALDQLAVDTNLELLRRSHSDDVVIDLPPQAHFEFIFAIQREIVMHSETAARAERQFVAYSNVLFQ